MGVFLRLPSEVGKGISRQLDSLNDRLPTGKAASWKLSGIRSGDKFWRNP
ncbi:MAG: hypothetical protein JNM42_11150 [Propionivibrio sp.]|nr:hypothetical protein [Propionivibrio sp.]MBL8414984.1 hypothetical protein [Propionivibrio sp.]